MDHNAGVLLLNATYEPLRIIPLFRAVCMIVDEKVMAIHEDETRGPIRSQYLSLPFPSVVRLINYAHVPFKSKTRLNTRTVVSRDNKECCYCGGVADTVDHIYPTSRGGKNLWTNVVAACARCNSIKSDKLLSELQSEGNGRDWKMRYQPTIPPQNHWLTVSSSQRDTWNQYVPELSASHG